MLEIITVEDGKRRLLRDVIPWEGSFSSEAAWSGCSIEQGTSPAAEAPENVCGRHAIWLHLGPPTRFESRAPGQGLRVFTLRPRSLLFIPAGMPFRGRWRDPISSLGLQIEPELISEVMGEHLARSFELPMGHVDPDPFMTEALHAMRRDLNEGLPCGRLYGESIATGLVAHLVRRHGANRSATDSATGGLPNYRFRRVVDFIHDRLHEDVSLGAMASLLGLNRSHFARAFKRTAGVSPYQFVVLRRIERACSLLEDPRVPIGEIATSCGFSSQSAFTATFRRVRGMPPGKYRKVMA